MQEVLASMIEKLNINTTATEVLNTSCNGSFVETPCAPMNTTEDLMNMFDSEHSQESSDGGGLWEFSEFEMSGSMFEIMHQPS